MVKDLRELLGAIKTAGKVLIVLLPFFLLLTSLVSQIHDPLIYDRCLLSRPDLDQYSVVQSGNTVGFVDREGALNLIRVSKNYSTEQRKFVVEGQVELLDFLNIHNRETIIIITRTDNQTLVVQEFNDLQKTGEYTVNCVEDVIGLFETESADYVATSEGFIDFRKSLCYSCSPFNENWVPYSFETVELPDKSCVGLKAYTNGMVQIFTPELSELTVFGIDEINSVFLKREESGCLSVDSPVDYFTMINDSGESEVLVVTRWGLYTYNLERDSVTETHEMRDDFNLFALDNVFVLTTEDSSFTLIAQLDEINGLNDFADNSQMWTIDPVGSLLGVFRVSREWLELLVVDSYGLGIIRLQYDPNFKELGMILSASFSSWFVLIDYFLLFLWLIIVWSLIESREESSGSFIQIPFTRKLAFCLIVSIMTAESSLILNYFLASTCSASFDCIELASVLIMMTAVVFIPLLMRHNLIMCCNPQKWRLPLFIIASMALQLLLEFFPIVTEQAVRLEVIMLDSNRPGYTEYESVDRVSFDFLEESFVTLSITDYCPKWVLIRAVSRNTDLELDSIRPGFPLEECFSELESSVIALTTADGLLVRMPENISREKYMTPLEFRFRMKKLRILELPMIPKKVTSEFFVSVKKGIVDDNMILYSGLQSFSPFDAFASGYSVSEKSISEKTILNVSSTGRISSLSLVTEENWVTLPPEEVDTVVALPINLKISIEHRSFVFSLISMFTNLMSAERDSSRY